MGGTVKQPPPFWLSQIGNELFLDEYPGCPGLSLLGIRGSRAAPGETTLVWKLTSDEGEPNKRAGHGLELTLGMHLPGIFAARTRLVGALEMEKLQPMHAEPSAQRILHMAFVIVAFSAAGVLTRDLNKHNWGVRSLSPNSCIEELVALDGADWQQEPKPVAFPPRRRLESWWNWIEKVDPETTYWLRC
ncbi:unnamed protein product [Symbiodinium sp. CCMP2592]|nr:unnamed protein product [Symbiodinium sp. CCMP2592]